MDASALPEAAALADAGNDADAADARADVREAGKAPVAPVSTRHWKTGGVPPPSYDHGF